MPVTSTGHPLFLFMENLMESSSDILTVKEIARRLRCSKAHVFNAINGKLSGVTRMPAINMGRRTIVRAAAFEAWLTQNESSQTA